jgi:hypothetical protein
VEIISNFVHGSLIPPIVKVTPVSAEGESERQKSSSGGVKTRRVKGTINDKDNKRDRKSRSREERPRRERRDTTKSTKDTSLNEEKKEVDSSRRRGVINGANDDDSMRLEDEDVESDEGSDTKSSTDTSEVSKEVEDLITSFEYDIEENDSVPMDISLEAPCKDNNMDEDDDIDEIIVFKPNFTKPVWKEENIDNTSANNKSNVSDNCLDEDSVNFLREIHERNINNYNFSNSPSTHSNKAIWGNNHGTVGFNASNLPSQNSLYGNMERSNFDGLFNVKSHEDLSAIDVPPPPPGFESVARISDNFGQRGNLMNYPIEDQHIGQLGGWKPSSHSSSVFDALNIPFSDMPQNGNQLFGGLSNLPGPRNDDYVGGDFCVDEWAKSNMNHFGV